jgi:hypothetical protein
MKKDLEILKKLLSEQDEETPEETPVEEPKEGSFEADPMEFILKKYHSLKEIMSELMTEDFEEFVDGIFVMAPKPTTFKIMLHNGQYFFLTYLGRAYEAQIAGKKYYLMGIGEKERCMMAISRMLRFGTPLKTQGPEGAEQGTRDNTGMEGDWAEKTGDMSAGGELGGAMSTGGGEEGGGEAEAGGEEELAEGIKVLKALLLKEVKEDPKLFLKHTINALEDAGEKPGNIDTKNGGPHTRATIGDETEAKNTITKALLDTGITKDEFSIDAKDPNDFKSGSRSGKFYTYVVTAKKDIELDNGQVIKKGSQAHVVSNVVAGKSTIAGKAFTPTTLGLSDQTFKGGNAIVKAVESKISGLKDKNLQKALSLLMNDVASEAGSKFSSVSEIKDYSKNIKLSPNTQATLKSILPADLDTIGKDFGEILGAILMGNEVKLQKGVYFPGGNEPLIDFYVDGYGISSKYKGGAAATLTKVVESVKPDQLTTANQKKLYEFLTEAFKNSPVSSSYLYMAKKLKNPALTLLAKNMKVAPESITLQTINGYVLSIIGGKPPKDKDPNADAKIKKALGSFFAEAGASPSFPINWGKLSNKKIYYGIVMSPLAYAVAKQMNEDKSLSSGLKDLISKAEIKQLYLDFNLGKSTASFKLRSFADPTATFSFTPSNMSVNNPNNGNMGFKMK